MPNNCIFCQISKGEVTETELLYSDSEYVAFKDYRPVAEHHYLIIPKTHFGKVSTLKRKHIPMIKTMEEIGKGLLVNRTKSEKVMEDALLGFHYPLCTVSHLHMHAIFPASSMSCFDRNFMYSKRLTFGTVDMALQHLSSRS